MKVPASPSTAFQLDIAGLITSIHIDHPIVADRIITRYQKFITTDKPANFSINIVVQEEQDTPDQLYPEFTFSNGRVCFDDDGTKGSIDIAASHADAILTTQRPVEHATYFIRTVYALLAFQAGGLLFHGAGIIHKDSAYVFFGHSGAGKTTLCRMSTNDIILNDDLLLLVPSTDGWQVFSTPFWNPTQITPTQAHAPLKVMLRLVQSKEVKLNPIEGGIALAELISNAPVISADPSRSLLLLKRCHQLMDAAPLFYLHFRKDPSFWELIDKSGFI